MENNFFIVAGIDKYNACYWLKNTDPVMWCSEKSSCKTYQLFSDADFDIHMNEDTFRMIFNSSGMRKIIVYEVDDNWNVYSENIVLTKEE